MANISNINNHFIVDTSGKGVFGDVASFSSTQHGPLNVFKSGAAAAICLDSSGGNGRMYQLRSETNGAFVIYDNPSCNHRMEISSGGEVTFSGNVKVTGAFKDSSGDAGTSGQILSSTATGSNWIDNDTGDISGSGTTNAVAKFTGAKVIGDGPITFATNDSTFAGNVDIYSGGSSATLNIGRNASEKLSIHQDDNDTTLTADNDADGNGTHNFILNRTFDGSGPNNFVVQKDGSSQFTIDTSSNATFAGNVSPASDAAQTLGGSSKRWNYGYFNNTVSVTDGNISAGTTFNFNQGATFAGLVTAVGISSTIASATSGYFATGTAIPANQILHVRDNVGQVATNSAGGIKISSSPGNDVFLLKRNNGSTSYFALQNSSGTEFITTDMATGNTTFTGSVHIDTKANSGLAYNVLIDIGSNGDGTIGYQTPTQLVDNLTGGYNGLTFADGTEQLNTAAACVIATPSRSSSPDPEDYQRSFSTEFKGKTASGSPGTGSSWIGLVSMSPYRPQTSGFYTTQLGFGADGTNGDMFIRRGTTTSWGDWRKFIISDSSGNTTFTGQLTVDYSTADAIIRLSKGSSTIGNIDFVNEGNRFSIQDDGARRLVIDTSGNVGIGTTSPGRKLTVTGDVTGDANNLLLSNENDTNGDSASIGFSMLSNNTYVKSGIFFERTTTQGRGSLHLAVNNEVNGNNVTKSDAKLTINNTGNVGIGTASPSEKLYVASSAGYIATFQSTTATDFRPIRFINSAGANVGFLGNNGSNNEFSTLR